MNLHYPWSHSTVYVSLGDEPIELKLLFFLPLPLKPTWDLPGNFHDPCSYGEVSDPIQSKSTQFKRHSPCWMDLVVAPFFVACFILLLCSTFHKLGAPPDELCVCYDVTQGMAQGSLWRAVEVRWGKVEQFRTVRASVELFRDTDVWFWKCNNVLVYILGLFSRLTSKTCAIYSDTN